MKRSIFLLPVIAVLTAGAAWAAAFGAADSPAPKLAAGDAASASRPPMIVQNPDGTFTVQLARRSANQALVIPPQIVVPLIPHRYLAEAKKKAGE
jgi:hypothetical protein